MTHWQPRALQLTDLKGDVILEGPSDESETTDILHLLDQLALKYTSETLQ
jgi:fatty acid synthase, animal type